MENWSDTLFPPDDPPDFEAMAALQQRYGMTMDFASAPRLIEEHGLQMPGA